MLHEPNQRLSAAANRLKVSLWTLIRTLSRQEPTDKRDSTKLKCTSPAAGVPEFPAREYYDR